MKITCSVLREAPTSDGKAGPFSFRRCAAAFLLAAALALFVLGLEIAKTLSANVPGWIIAVPGALCLLGALLMPILTTISDMQALIQAVRGAAKTPEGI